MEGYLIEGGRRLTGTAAVHGAKNSVLPILSATLLARGESVIRNCPNLTDVDAACAILRYLGCTVSRDGTTVTVDARTVDRCDIPDPLMQEMRSSVLFLGALLARMREAELCYPGGCELGPRPIDLHLRALTLLGMKTRQEGSRLFCTASGLTGRQILLEAPSVGATENTLLAACGSLGDTTIYNVAREPEIVELQGFLRSMGARVQGAGSSMITVYGGEPLHGGEYTVGADRIVASTYLTAVAAAGGEAVLTGADCGTVSPVIAALMEAGCEIRGDAEHIEIRSDAPLRGVRLIYTAPYPGFPTDAQPMLMAALAGGTGETLMVENIFTGRYHHVPALVSMGADIRVNGREALIRGAGRLHGAQVTAMDLRGGAALVVAALGAEGGSLIGGLPHIDRGYDGLDETLRGLGAGIRRIRLPEDTAEEQIGTEDGQNGEETTQKQISQEETEPLPL